MKAWPWIAAIGVRGRAGLCHQPGHLATGGRALLRHQHRHLSGAHRLGRRQQFDVTPKFVEPGVRRLVLQGRRAAPAFSAVETFTLEVKPCTRYYIVAVKANPLDTNFTPKVDFEQPLGSSCRVP